MASDASSSKAREANVAEREIVSRRWKNVRKTVSEKTDCPKIPTTKVTRCVNGVAVATRAGLTTTTTAGATAVATVPVATKDVIRARVLRSNRGAIRSAVQITATASGLGTATAVRRATAEEDLPATVTNAAATVATAASVLGFTVPAYAHRLPYIP